MKIVSKLVAGAFCFAAASSAMAAAITGSGAPSANAALAGGTTIGFDTTASGTYSTLTLAGVTFSSTGAPFTVGTDFNGNYNTTGGKSVYNDFDLAPDNFRFTFATTVSAFGFNWGAADNTWTLRAYDSGSNLLETLSIAGTFASNAGQYFGIARAGISYATLTDTRNNIASGDFVFIDRFTYAGAVTAVPEPTTLALFGLGLLGLAFARKRSKV